MTMLYLPGGVTVGLGVLAIPIDDKGVDAQLGGSDGLECIGGQMGVCLIVQVRSAKGGALLYCVEVGGEGCDGMVSACALGVQGGQVTGGRNDALAGCTRTPGLPQRSPEACHLPPDRGLPHSCLPHSR